MAKQEITDYKTSLISRLDQERCAGLVMSSRSQQPARIGPIGIAFVESQINYGAGSGYKPSRMSGVLSTSLARLFWKRALLERISRVCCLLECKPAIDCGITAPGLKDDGRPVNNLVRRTVKVRDL